LQNLARAMQEHPAGRQVQVSREWAAHILAPRFRKIASEEQRERAAQFLEEEELGSGIVVRRGSDIRFWHLTFQEHLAARALAGEDDAGRHKVLFLEQRAWNPDWREVVLLFAGLLHEKKVERVDALVSAALDTLSGITLPDRLRSWWKGGPSLARQARCVSLLGAMLLDLEPLKYKPKDPRYEETLRAVVGIFDPQLSAAVPLRARIEAAKALGQAGDQAGDPRLRRTNVAKVWRSSQGGDAWIARLGGQGGKVLLGVGSGKPIAAAKPLPPSALLRHHCHNSRLTVWLKGTRGSLRPLPKTLAIRPSKLMSSLRRLMASSSLIPRSRMNIAKVQARRSCLVGVNPSL